MVHLGRVRHWAGSAVYYDGAAVQAYDVNLLCKAFLATLHETEGGQHKRIVLQTEMTNLRSAIIRESDYRRGEHVQSELVAYHKRIAEVRQALHTLEPLSGGDLTIQGVDQFSKFSHHGQQLFPSLECYMTGDPDSDRFRKTIEQCAERFIPD